jgi:hypothetical protein
MTGPTGYEQLGTAVSTLDILASIRPALTEVADFINGDGGPYARLAHDDEHTYPPAELGPLDKGVAETTTRLIAVAAGAILQRPVEEIQEATARGFIDRHLTGLLDEKRLTSLARDVLAAAEKVRSLSEFTSQIIPGLELESDEQQFALMRLLSRTVRLPKQLSKRTPEEREVDALQTLYIFNILDGERLATSVPVMEKLGEGEFDTFIARDMLREVAQQTENPVNGVAELQKLLRLANRLSTKPLPETITALAHTESLASWPEACKKLLDNRRAQYQQSLQESQAHQKAFIEDHDCVVVRDSTEADVKRAVIELKVALAKRQAVDSSVSMPQRLGARIIVEADKKRKRSATKQAQTVGNTATAAALSSEAEAEAEAEPQTRRKLTYLAPGGEAPEGTPEYEALFRDYLEAHIGQSGLEEDLLKIREYLRTVDLSAGLPRGVYKMKGVPRGGLARCGTRIPKVYQLKPAEAIDLSTKSEDGDKLRVLFALRNGTVGLLGISPKADIAKLERNIGLVGRNHRK